MSRLCPVCKGSGRMLVPVAPDVTDEAMCVACDGVGTLSARKPTLEERIERLERLFVTIMSQVAWLDDPSHNTRALRDAIHAELADLDRKRGGG